jgi:lysophospholipase L1-like esterase
MPSFQSNDIAVWGRQIAQEIPLIRDIVFRYKPDILLVMPGFNDMGWFVSDAQGTLDSMVRVMCRHSECMLTLYYKQERFIGESRKVNPGVKLAVANVPQRSLIGGREDLPVMTTDYNRALPDLLQKYDNALAPTKLVDITSNYDCQPAHCPVQHFHAMRGTLWLTFITGGLRWIAPQCPWGIFNSPIFQPHAVK